MGMLRCCRVLPPLWLAACGCLRTSQLTKVRCHAAAALATMVEFFRGIRPGEVSQLYCGLCMAPLLTEAWRAVASASKTVSPSATLEDGRLPMHLLISAGHHTGAEGSTQVSPSMKHVRLQTASMGTDDAALRGWKFAHCVQWRFMC